MKLEVSKEEPKQDEEKPNDKGADLPQSQTSSDSDKDEKISNASNSTVLYSLDNESNKLDEYIRESEKLETPNDSENSSPKEEKNAEDEKLDKLLRLVSSNPYPKRSSAEEKENQETPKPHEKEVSKEKPKTPELSLIDCFSSQEPHEELMERVPREEKKDDDYEKKFNNEVRNLFLFTSESDESKTEEEKSHDDKKKPKKSGQKVSKKERKRRKDDLRKYRISASEDEDETENGKEKKKTSKNDKEKSSTEEKEKTPREDKTPAKAEADEHHDTLSDSGNSVEVLMLPSDSDSEVVQIGEVPRSSFPSKGRKNIKKILDVKNLQLETKQALKIETERKRRLKERQGLMKKLPELSGSKLILDFDPVTKKQHVVVDENLSKYLKPHQREGVQFMWNCCFESLERLKNEKGSGCVLAHCMGLGKTLQVITLIHSVLTHTKHLRTVLIMCPLVTLKNWYHEFKIWMTGCKNPIVPFDLGSAHRKKFNEIQKWTQNGGVLIVSYDMFRAIIKTEKYTYWRNWLLNPDIVVCDEGHLMKNPNSELSKCISRIRTSRRIVLTGTPLQNNLIEYYCMVQFVKPNLLGTKKEFMNRFENPISNGQFENSTQQDVQIMKQRSHVLHTLLESFVQRLGHDVLEPLLPEKQEFVISIALTRTQENMYNLCVKQPLTEGRGLLWDFHWFHKVWTHPITIRRYFEQNKIEKEQQEPWLKFLSEENYDKIRSSNKLLLLFNILKKCSQIGDKVLLFSQSLYSLNLIEEFLRKLNCDYEAGRQTEFADSWVLGRDFFKLTGTTKPEARENYYKQFAIDPRARLFLISTKTGGLGINLVAANRVILFDASWNPVHDLQSIFRVYRFGQKKPCYIYRFLAAATMEEKIYKRQVTKLSLAHRILDEHQIERHYTSHNLQELYTYDPIPKSEWKVPKIPKDEIFAEILSNNRDIIVSYHEHNSLLENKEGEELTEEERQAAWENYEKEKTSPQKILPERNYLPVFQQPLIGNQFGAMPEVAGIGNGNENQFKIVGMGQKSNGYLDSKNLRELGNSFGLKPDPGEKIEAYRVRVESMLKSIFPWGTPKVIIQGDVMLEK